MILQCSLNTDSFLIQVSGLVTHSVCKETALCASSVMAEKECFVEVLNAARLSFETIATVTTDANVQIRNYMKSDTVIKHGLDVWHVNKNLQKNLIKKAVKKLSIFCYKSSPNCIRLVRYLLKIQNCYTYLSKEETDCYCYMLVSLTVSFSGTETNFAMVAASYKPCMVVCHPVSWES